jgi:hypothetical protein
MTGSVTLFAPSGRGRVGRMRVGRPLWGTTPPEARLQDDRFQVAPQSVSSYTHEAAGAGSAAACDLEETWPTVRTG